jgi:hypothetical protein
MFKASVPILERKVIKGRLFIQKINLETSVIEGKSTRKLCFGWLFKTAVKIISSLNSEIAKPRPCKLKAMQ